MVKTKKILLVLLFTVFMLFLLQKSCYAASDFSYNSMDFDVQLNTDGSMDVVETWNIKINGETNTLFKNWNLDSQKFSKIENIRVTEVKGNGYETDLRNAYKYMYHVSTGYFYGLNVSDNNKEQFEIAWGVNQSSGTKTYKIYYTVQDCIKVYNDCSDLYWQFVNDTGGNRVSTITGVVKLPSAVSDIDSLKVWGHGNVNGETVRKDEQTITFSAKNYNSKYLELRIVTTEDIFYSADKVSEDKLDDILEYEKKLADKANFEKLVKKILSIIMIIVFYIINILFLKYVVKRKNILKENPKKVPTQKLEYYRDFPRKDATPAQVAFLHYFGSGSTRYNK